MDWLLILFFIVILLIGSLILFLVTKGGATKQLDTDRYRKKWLELENQLNKDEASSYQLAILNADKLLDHALKESGFRGETMGERMKSASERWSNANTTWAAHKLRNKIAHEQNVVVSFTTTRQALQAFKQSLKDLGAI